MAEEIVTFGIDGVSYEIRLPGPRADELRDQMRRYIVHARPVVTRTVRRRTRRDRLRTAAIRRWAAENGFEVSARGRLPGAVTAAYRENARVPDEH